jgi:hypothetical protein
MPKTPKDGLLNYEDIARFEETVRNLAVNRDSIDLFRTCPVVCVEGGSSPQLVMLCYGSGPSHTRIAHPVRAMVYVGRDWLISNAIPTRAFLRL